MVAPPLTAIITEGIVSLVVLFVVIMLFIKYQERKKIAALSLAVAFLSWDIGAFSLFTGKLLAYLKEYGIIPASIPIKFSELGINLGYGFSAISNIFILVFVTLVFSQSPLFRKTKMWIPIFFAALNGITVGLLIASTIRLWPEPTYDLIPTIYHLLLTFISFGFLGIFTLKPLKQAVFKWEKAGFGFILTSAIFGILIYLSFAVDSVLGNVELFPGAEGYTPFYYLAYAFAVLMCSFAYLGYVMPGFIRNRLKSKEEEQIPAKTV